MTSAVALPIRHRLRLGVKHPQNWLQLGRFGAVGATGYIVNLAVFALCVHVFSIDYRIADLFAFSVSVLNNFWWNRHWTFDARHHPPLSQCARFFAVSLVAFGFQYAVLVTLVGDAGLSKVLAQAIAIACATPMSFLGQKLWSFKA